jgi:hypothetical protein
MKKILEKMQFVGCFGMRRKMKKIWEIMQFVGCFLLIAMKNEENLGYNAICWMFFGWL